MPPRSNWTWSPLRQTLWIGLLLTCALTAALPAGEPTPTPPAVEPPPPVPAPRGPLAQIEPPAAQIPPRAPQPLPEVPDAELDEVMEQGPRHPTPGAVKLSIKRDGVEVTLEAPAALFDAEELKDLLANYLPKPDPNGLGIRVYNLRKRGIDIPFEVVEKLARKAARGADEEQPELNFHFDEPNRLLIVSAWEPVLLDRIDLLIEALAKEQAPAERFMGQPFFMPGPGFGGPGGPGGQGGMGGPGGMVQPGAGPGMRGEMPAQGRPNPPAGEGAGGGADAEMQRRKQLEQEQLQKRLEKERRQDNRERRPDGELPPREAPPPGRDEQF